MERAVIKRAGSYDAEQIKRIVSEALDEIGGPGRFIRKGMRIALKPNLVMKKSPECAATTNPAVVSAVGSLIRELGAQAVLIESPGGPFTRSRLKNVYDATGMTEACAKAGIELNYDMDMADIKNDEGMMIRNVTVVKAFETVDAVINLPKLKTHGQMIYTGAVKNMFGIVPGIIKAEHHFRMQDYDDFADSIIDIFMSKKPVLNIMDAIEAMEGNGPSAGHARKLGCLLISEDAFLLDYIACRMICLDYRDVPMMRQAVKRGYLDPGASEKEARKADEYLCRDFQIPSRDNPRLIDFSDRSPSGRFIKLLKPKPVFDRKKCILCAECIRSCPAGVLDIKNGKIIVDLDGCIRCYCCQELCPEGAVTIKRGAAVDLVLKAERLIKGGSR